MSLYDEMMKKVAETRAETAGLAGSMSWQEMEEALFQPMSKEELAEIARQKQEQEDIQAWRETGAPGTPVQFGTPGGYARSFDLEGRPTPSAQELVEQRPAAQQEQQQMAMKVKGRGFPALPKGFWSGPQHDYWDGGAQRAFTEGGYEVTPEQMGYAFDPSTKFGKAIAERGEFVSPVTGTVDELEAAKEFSDGPPGVVEIENVPRILPKVMTADDSTAWNSQYKKALKSLPEKDRERLIGARELSYSDYPFGAVTDPAMSEMSRGMISKILSDNKHLLSPSDRIVLEIGPSYTGSEAVSEERKMAFLGKDRSFLASELMAQFHPEGRRRYTPGELEPYRVTERLPMTGAPRLSEKKTPHARELFDWAAGKLAAEFSPEQYGVDARGFPSDSQEFFQRPGTGAIERGKFVPTPIVPVWAEKTAAKPLWFNPNNTGRLLGEATWDENLAARILQAPRMAENWLSKHLAHIPYLKGQMPDEPSLKWQAENLGVVFFPSTTLAAADALAVITDPDASSRKVAEWMKAITNIPERARTGAEIGYGITTKRPWVFYDAIEHFGPNLWEVGHGMTFGLAEMANKFVNPFSRRNVWSKEQSIRRGMDEFSEGAGGMAKGMLNSFYRSVPGVDLENMLRYQPLDVFLNLSMVKAPITRAMKKQSTKYYERAHEALSEHSRIMGKYFGEDGMIRQLYGTGAPYMAGRTAAQIIAFRDKVKKTADDLSYRAQVDLQKSGLIDLAIDGFTYATAPMSIFAPIEILEVLVRRGFGDKGQGFGRYLAMSPHSKAAAGKALAFFQAVEREGLSANRKSILNVQDLAASFLERPIEEYRAGVRTPEAMAVLEEAGFKAYEKIADVETGVPEDMSVIKGYRMGESKEKLPRIGTIRENKITPLSNYTDRLFTETDAVSAWDVFLSGRPTVVGPGIQDLTSLWFSRSANLARGQKRTGVIIEMLPGDITGRVNTQMPGWDFAWKDLGEAEFFSDNVSVPQIRKNIVSVTVKKGALGKPKGYTVDSPEYIDWRFKGRRARNILNNKKLWSSVRNPDGSTTYYPKIAKPVQRLKSDLLTHDELVGMVGRGEAIITKGGVLRKKELATFRPNVGDNVGTTFNEMAWMEHEPIFFNDPARDLAKLDQKTGLWELTDAGKKELQLGVDAKGKPIDQSNVPIDVIQKRNEVAGKMATMNIWGVDLVKKSLLYSEEAHNLKLFHHPEQIRNFFWSNLYHPSALKAVSLDDIARRVAKEESGTVAPGARGSLLQNELRKMGIPIEARLIRVGEQIPAEIITKHLKETNARGSKAKKLRDDVMWEVDGYAKHYPELNRAIRILITDSKHSVTKTAQLPTDILGAVSRWQKRGGLDAVRERWGSVPEVVSKEIKYFKSIKEKLKAAASENSAYQKMKRANEIMEDRNGKPGNLGPGGFGMTDDFFKIATTGLGKLGSMVEMHKIYRNAARNNIVAKHKSPGVGWMEMPNEALYESFYKEWNLKQLQVEGKRLGVSRNVISNASHGGRSALIAELNKRSPKKYGELAGMWVHEDVWYHLINGQAFIQELGEWYPRVTSKWKSAMTAWSPTTTIRNVLSNIMFFAPMAGISILNPKNWKYYQQAFKDAFSNKKSRHWRETFEDGVFESSFMMAELGMKGSDFVPMQAVWKTPLDGFKEFFGLVDRVHHGAGPKGWIKKRHHGWGDATKLPGLFYTKVCDDIFRQAYHHKFKDRVGRPKAAAGAMEKFIDYKNVPGLVNMLRLPFAPRYKLGAEGVPLALPGAKALHFIAAQPFISWTMRSAPLTIEWLAREPIQASIYMAMHDAMTYHGFANSGITPEYADELSGMVYGMDKWQRMRYAPAASLSELVELVGTMREVPKKGGGTTLERGEVFYDTNLFNPFGYATPRLDPIKDKNLWRYAQKLGVLDHFIGAPLYNAFKAVSMEDDPETGYTKAYNILADNFWPPVAPSPVFISSIFGGRGSSEQVNRKHGGRAWEKAASAYHGWPERDGYIRSVALKLLDIAALRTIDPSPTNLVIHRARDFLVKVDRYKSLLTKEYGSVADTERWADKPMASDQELVKAAKLNQFHNDNIRQHKLNDYAHKMAVGLHLQIVKMPAKEAKVDLESASLAFLSDTTTENREELIRVIRKWYAATEEIRKRRAEIHREKKQLSEEDERILSGERLKEMRQEQESRVKLLENR